MRQLATTGVADIAAVDDLEVVAATLPYQRANHVVREGHARGRRRARRGVDGREARRGRQAHPSGGRARLRPRPRAARAVRHPRRRHRRQRGAGGHRRRPDDLRRRVEEARQGDLRPPDLRDGRLEQRPRHARPPVAAARLQRRRERRDGRPARADGARPGRLALQCRDSGGAGRQPRPGRREGARSTGSSRTCTTSASARSGRPRATSITSTSTWPTPPPSASASGRAARWARWRRPRWWSSWSTGTRRCCRSRASAALRARSSAAPPDMEVAATICDVLDDSTRPRRCGCRRSRRRSWSRACTTCKVYGDHDSLGVFQQRRAGWGSRAADPRPRCTRRRVHYARRCRANWSQSAGQLAQDVQISNFPMRYDGVPLQAYGLMQTVCGSSGCSSLALVLAGCGRPTSAGASRWRRPTIDSRRFGADVTLSPRRRAPDQLVGGAGAGRRCGRRRRHRGPRLRAPGTLETSTDASMRRLVWSSWAADGASARGEFRVQDCQPTCAVGHARRLPATVALSDVKTCDGRRYFGRAVVKLALGSGADLLRAGAVLRPASRGLAPGARTSGRASGRSARRTSGRTTPRRVWHHARGQPVDVDRADDALHELGRVLH